MGERPIEVYRSVGKTDVDLRYHKLQDDRAKRLAEAFFRRRM